MYTIKFLLNTNTEYRDELTAESLEAAMKVVDELEEDELLDCRIGIVDGNNNVVARRDIDETEWQYIPQGVTFYQRDDIEESNAANPICVTADDREWFNREWGMTDGDWHEALNRELIAFGIEE